MKNAYNAFQEGLRLLETGSAHAAVIQLERAKEAEPRKASVREALARAYYRTANFRLAAAEFAYVLELDPVNDYALFGLGKSQLRLGQPEIARGDLRLALAMQPENEHYQQALNELDARAQDSTSDA